MAIFMKNSLLEVSIFLSKGPLHYMHQIHILIPKLLCPLKLWKQDFGFQAKSLLLSELLASSQKKNTHTHGLTATLFSKLNHPSDEELPYAHYRYQLDFGKTPDTPIMCADPVNLQAGIDEIILSPEPINNLSKADSEELIGALNTHFAQDNWEFIVADSGNWYLKHHANETIKTTPLDQVRAKSIFKYLPQSDTLNWHSLQNEIQMLLHMTSLNQTRELAGQQTINSLWFWGAGNAQQLEHNFDTIWGSEQNKAVALAGNMAHNSINNLKLDLPNGNHIIVLDDLYYPAIQDHYGQWQKALEQLETKVFLPISRHYKQKKYNIIINSCDGKEFQITSKKSWKFWKKANIDLLKLA